ncbi:hypothetical protein [Nioella sp. MMSF_3534]|uniref:hypothetical protein n=1 Tax=Nioella sp. MMSF_3534 TaxID=3046720 RepID=UPI00273D2295|nr:hypothetical protein [Nioella sp. MMSF_3534]
MRFLALFAALLASPATAQDLSLTETDTLPRLIDSLCVDIHPLNGCEQVILLTSRDDESSADLVILSDRRLQDDPGAPLLVLRDAAYNGSMWGMSPSLEEGEGRTVLLRSEQSGIGRHPWFQTLRIGWQEDAFRVQGFGYSSYDRFTSGGYSCSLDYDSGDWRAEATWVDPESEAEQSVAQRGTLDSPAPLLSDHGAFAALPAPCQTVQTLFFDNLP